MARHSSRPAYQSCYDTIVAKIDPVGDAFANEA
jgi:hypothetical protein